MADRLYVEKEVKENLIPKLDDKKIFNLDKTHIERIELFLYAMSLGLKENELCEVKHSDGLIREASIQPEQMSLITSLLACKLIKENEIDAITDKEKIYSLAQNYANKGFLIIKGYVEDYSKEREEELIWSLLSDLDDKYEEIFSV